jgi:succinate dehydrogenase/fumarate reductase cytochrome b subunit
MPTIDGMTKTSDPLFMIGEILCGLVILYFVYWGIRTAIGREGNEKDKPTTGEHVVWILAALGVLAVLWAISTMIGPLDIKP